jgi:predicted amidohydrolase
MTKNHNFKQKVRARSVKTGESYTAARQHLVNSSETDPTSPLPPLRLATAQMTVHGDPTDLDLLRASGAELRQLMREAREKGARLVHFPEGATCFPHKQVLSSTGSDVVGEADWTRCQWDTLRNELNAIQTAARDLRLWTVFGSVHRLTPPHRPHNSLYVLSDRGEVVTRYDERMLSKTKVSFMYAPGATPATFEVDGYRFGCALGMESHFPELFIEYEALGVDCVLFSTTGGFPSDAPMFASETCGHAAANSYWISFSVPAAHSLGAPSGIVSPTGVWAAQCPSNGCSSVTTFDISIDPSSYSRPWRRIARSGIYAKHHVEDDSRSNDRRNF